MHNYNYVGCAVYIIFRENCFNTKLFDTKLFYHSVKMK